MKRIATILLLIVVFSRTQAQDWQLEALVGISGYGGDFPTSDVSFKSWHPAFNFNVKYQLTSAIGFRVGMGYGDVSGDDKASEKPDFKARNLNFKTDILEGNFAVVINLLSPELFDLYPYVFAGVGYYHFNPYTYNDNGVKTYLQPLSTEGEGLPEYPDRKVYSLNQFCIPFGGGVNLKISEDFDLGLEGGLRKLFTDHLDDLSNSYIDRTTLLNAKGEEAVALAYRNPYGTPYPPDGQVRGDPKKNDLYYFLGFKVTYHIGGRKGPYGQPQPEHYRY